MMRLSLISIGKLKDAHELALFARYHKRIASSAGPLGFSKLDCREFPESRAKSADLRKAQEAAQIEKAAAAITAKVILDERGTTMTSRAFATWLAERRDAGTSSMAFIIGGPDGHSDSIKKSATNALSLSSLTLPHGLARILFAEQLYRALTILGHHPYHRD